jgi:hypothetical protein
MGMFKYAYFVLAATFLIMSSLLVYNSEENKSYNFNRHQNLHPMQVPFDIVYNMGVKDQTSANILVADLSTVTFNTPAFSSRLASASDIQMMLNEPNPLTSVVYPIIDNTVKSRRLFDLSIYDVKMKDGVMVYNAPPVMTNRTQSITSVQNILKVDDEVRLKLVQTDYYCPIRLGKTIENYQDWKTRTEQKSETFKEKYESHMQFRYNNIHETKCHIQRVDSMVMAHVGIDLYSIFSTHSSNTLLLGVTCIGFAFSSFIAINLLRRDIQLKIKNEPQASSENDRTAAETRRIKEMKLHTLTTLFKIVCVFIVILLLSLEYMFKTSYAEATKNRIIPTSSFLFVFCSSVVSFLILYMHGPFKIYGDDNRIENEIKEYCQGCRNDEVNKYLVNMGIDVGTGKGTVESQDAGLLDNNESQNNSAPACDQLIKSGLFPSMDIIKEKIESETEVLLCSYAWFVTMPLFFMSLYANNIYGVDLNMQLILIPIIAVFVLDIIYIRIALIIDVVWDIYIKNQRDNVFDSGQKSPDLPDMPPLKHILYWLKLILWVVFLVIRLTIIIIPYTVFKDESKNNYELVLGFQVVFEVIPVLLGLIDLIHTSRQKDMDMLSLNQSTQGTKASMTDRVFTTIEQLMEAKNPSLRIYLSLIVYYPLLVIACAVMVGVYYEQKMPNDQALKLPMFFAY